MENNSQLAVVMPVYNEQEIIRRVVKDWTEELSQLSIDFKIHTYNDGSKDNTLSVLNDLALENPNLIVHDKKNSGHGPTLIQAYRENSDVEWIFQVDSDNEIGVEGFKILWENRDHYQLLIGWRKARIQPPTRKLLSFVSRLLIKIFYGRSMIDVNSPYRLMNTEHLKDLFVGLPDNSFGPNILISGFASLKRLDLYEAAVLSKIRMTGEFSLTKVKLIKSAAICFCQTIAFRFNRKLKKILVKKEILEEVLEKV